ncbi:oxygenase MpaB family protein [Streptomyces sp. NPDC018019]|uniref:oxygenase MpaB family protein n=1 Tax=Streptomyces sp. NPDC018019 TaxID=3365030 RepID=UPI003787F20D
MTPGGPSLPEAEALYRRLAFTEFCEDLMLGLNIGFYRTFAVPEIAAVLATTGQMTGQTELRAKTTGQMMYRLFRDGLDSPSGARTVSALNNVHARWQISNDAFRYVLACFDVAPMRWCDAYGWRATTAAEKDASHVFYCALADRMGIHRVPLAWGAFAAWMDDYENGFFARTPEATALWAATSGLLAQRVPAFLVPLVRSAAGALLDPPLRRALGVRRPPTAVSALAAGGMHIRARRLRHLHSDPGYRPALPDELRELG